MEENNFDLSGAVEKLQEMMGSEEGQGQLQSILQMFTSEAPTPSPSGSTTGGIDPDNLEMFFKLQQAMAAMNSPQNDENVRFLQSLKLYLKERRQNKIDSAVRMLRLSKVIEAMKDING